MTLTILQNNSGVKVAVLNRKNFQSLVDAALTRKIKPFARVRDPYPQTTIDGRNCSGSITVVNATNRLRTALFNDEEVAVITVNIPTLDACAVTTSYYFRVVRTAFKDWTYRLKPMLSGESVSVRMSSSA